MKALNTRSAIAILVLLCACSTAAPQPEPPGDASPGDTWTRPADGATMVYVPAGEFPYGPGSTTDVPERRFYLDAFWIDRTEVTNAQYARCVAASACLEPLHTAPYEDPSRADHPVVAISPGEAEACCAWAGGRLPREIEWENDGEMSEMRADTLITPEQTLAAARQAGLSDAELMLSGIAVLTFSKAVMDRLGELCALEDAQWISSLHHPYAAPHVVRRGTFQGLGVTALVPPMGASPLACVVEDLVTCGSEAIFLVCAAWSLGPPVQFGDLIVPSFSAGPDGTSIHYGNPSGHVSADPAVVEALAGAGRERGATVHTGGNGSCEALYRITPRMAEDFRERGCLCVENGEASTLFAMARTLGVLGGVLFQPYIELERGWEPARLREERYRATCRLQAEVVLEASTRLRRQGLLDMDMFHLS